METKGWKSFWTALWVSLLVLLPLVAGTAVLAQRQAAGQVRASESQSGVPVQLPRAENHLTLLACVAGEDPAFVLLYLNADQNCIHLLGVPGQLAVPFSDGEASLADCWPTAMRRPGRPGACRAWARWWTCPRTPAIWPPHPRPWPASATPMEACGWVFRGFCRRRSAPALTRPACGTGTALRPMPFCRSWRTVWPPTRPPPPGPPSGTLFSGRTWKPLREASGSLLTDLTAADLLTLEDTLELLANNGAVVESSVLPGRTDRRSGLYVLGEEAGPAVQAFFNVADSAPASGTQSASSSAPYPSTSVPGGQPAGPSM